MSMLLTNRNMVFPLSAEAAPPPASGDFVGFGAVDHAGTQNGALNATLDGPSTSLTTRTVTNPDADATGAGSLRDAIQSNSYVDIQVDLNYGNGTGSDHDLSSLTNVFINGNGHRITKDIAYQASSTPPGDYTSNGIVMSMQDCSDIVFHNMEVDAHFRIDGAAGPNTDIMNNGRGDHFGASGNCERIIWDHLVSIGSDDGGLDITGFDSSGLYSEAWIANRNLSITNCIVSDTTVASLFKYGGLKYLTLYRNLYANNKERNPQLRGTSHVVDISSHLVYNWEDYAIRVYDDQPTNTDYFNQTGDGQFRGNIRGVIFEDGSRTQTFNGNVAAWQIYTGSGNDGNFSSSMPGSTSLSNEFYADNCHYNSTPLYDMVAHRTTETPVTIPAASQAPAPSTNKTTLANDIIDNVGVIGLGSAYQQALKSEIRTAMGL